MENFNINDIPAMSPPPGRTSNFNDPETMHPVVLGVAVSTMVLMTMAVMVRVYTKGVILKDMRLEEYFAILGTAGIIVWDSIFIHVSMHGFSRHLWDVRAVDVPHLAYMNYLAEISNAVTMWAAKCSILFQLKSLFCPGHSRGVVYWSIHALLFLNGAYHTAALFTFIFQCTPREKTWNALMEGQCINVAAATQVSGAVNLFLDLGILVTPVAAIFHLQMPTKRKLGISAVFGVGILTCAIAAFGVVLRIPLLYDPDLTWVITRVGIWTMVEYCGTILVGCMPSFPRFFTYLRGDPSTTSATGFSSPVSKATSRAYDHSRQESRGSHEHSETKSGNNKSITGIQVGIGITTSEVSLTDPALRNDDALLLNLHGLAIDDLPEFQFTFQFRAQPQAKIPNMLLNRRREKP
ncbi:hypothetical protein MFIFM68171_03957 [Madurella fahalii]|uniref:Rhodopsin domain-containing protein n=1 Tax=Madurella fahalii TaxID=1157608 RepID=A0ABQ0G7L0_9PEZI